MKIPRSLSSLFLASLFLAVLLPATVFAAMNVTGTWRGKMDNGADAVFHLRNDGNSLTGTMLGADGKDHPLTEAKLDGNNISFKVPTEWQGMPVTLIVTGTSQGNQMRVRIAADNGYWSTDATLKREDK